MKLFNSTRPMPGHLRYFEGSLYDDRKPYSFGPIREKFSWHYSRPESLSQVKATIRAGSFAWPGGYPLFLITQDCQPLCWQCAVKEFRQIVWDHLNKCSTGWRIIGCEINYEDDNCFCCHCSKQIESAYGESQEEVKS